MKSGIELIATERQEQIEKHGRTVQSDSIYNKNGEMVRAAIALTKQVIGIGFPLTWDEKLCDKMYNKTQIERLAIAGALIAAEIDRLNTP